MVVLDHVVLPVGSIFSARSRLERLGFSVGPNARHPFGTENACVYFSDETYLEPLAVGDETAFARALAEGNSFARLNAAFLEQNGDEGLSAIALKSGDADADQARFIAAGCSHGEMLTFSRPLNGPGDDGAVATFKLAFSGTPVRGAFHIFTCQRINVSRLADVKALMHENGALGIRSVDLCDDGAQASSDYLASVLGSPIECGNVQEYSLHGSVLRLSRDAPYVAMGGAGVAEKNAGLCGIAVVFAVRDVRKTASLFAANDVACFDEGSRIVVPRGEGQGAIFIFEEEPV